MYNAADTNLRWLVDGCHLCSDAQRDVCVLGVASVQVAHPLTSRLPPEIQETVGDGVILKHDVVYMSVFLKETEQKAIRANSNSVFIPLYCVLKLGGCYDAVPVC